MVDEPAFQLEIKVDFPNNDNHYIPRKYLYKLKTGLSIRTLEIE